MSARKPLLKEETARVWAYLRAYRVENHGMAPSIREVARGCFMAPSQVVLHLQILEAHGLIMRQEGKARGLWMTDDSTDDGA